MLVCLLISSKYTSYKDSCVNLFADILVYSVQAIVAATIATTIASCKHAIMIHSADTFVEYIMPIKQT